MLIKITTDVVGYRTELQEVPDNTDLDDILNNDGLPEGSNFLRTLSEKIGSTEVIDVEEV